mgnify:CR=1 FL=1
MLMNEPLYVRKDIMMAKLGDVFPLIRNGASIKQTDGAEGLPITYAKL